MYLKVSLLDTSLDKSVAEIVPKETENGVLCYVYSENEKMKAHLEKLLLIPAYIPSPGRNTSNFFADSVIYLQPGTLYFVNALPEILSWRGYNVEVSTEVHKSFAYEDFIPDVIKSTESITYNEKGERVVKVVPAGYVAVNTDGRVVAGGRYLNANIDKEGASWSLVENPYEGQTPQQRQSARQYMDVGLQEYHPGAVEDVYQKRQTEDDQDYYQAPEDYKPEGGKNLQEYFLSGVPEVLSDAPSRYPGYLEPGNVVYSPDTGQAFDTRFWPPGGIDYEKYSWYIFDGSSLSDEEKEFYAPISGLTPDLIPGVSSGIVQSEKGLDVSHGFKLGEEGSEEEQITDIDSVSAGSGIRPVPVPAEKYDIKDMLDRTWLESFKSVKAKLKAITDLTHKEIHPSLENMNIEGLRGAQANFSVSLYNYQKAIVSALLTEDQYEVFGGPKGWHGYFLNVKMGLGKTAIVAAANAVLRNRGRLRNGEQTTIVTAPNKNVFVWQSEIGKFLGEHAVVIDGDKQKRIEQWENIIEKARLGELPSFVVVGASKFRYVRGDEDDDEQDAWELDTDAKYMQLLAMGGSSGEKTVKGNHVGVFCVDESSQYVNPDSARHTAMKNIIDSVYHGKGIVWTLNGNISGNSAADTVSDLSFINKYVRDNYVSMVNEYTKLHTSSTRRETKASGRRVWKTYDRLKDFLYTFGSQIYSLDGRTVAGKDYGFVKTDDELSPFGKDWAHVYFESQRKLAAAAEGGSMNRALGLLSVLINSGMGSVHVSRLLEYDLATRRILSDVEKNISGDKLSSFREQYKKFLENATESSADTGRMPKRGVSTSERDTLYSTFFSQENRDLLEAVVDSWECPFVDGIVHSIRQDFQQNTISGKNRKVGVAGFSKLAINKVARKLREEYPPSRYLIQVVDGDTTADETDRVQKRHQAEKDRNVITLVTGAGLFGLSLPTDRTWRFATWNSAKGGQYDGRFHRKAEQKNVNTVVLPSGIMQYMRELELRKGSMAEAATNVLLEVDDSEDEIVISTNSVSRLLDKLRQYPPTIIDRGED